MHILSTINKSFRYTQNMNLDTNNCTGNAGQIHRKQTGSKIATGKWYRAGIRQTLYDHSFNFE